MTQHIRTAGCRSSEQPIHCACLFGADDNHTAYLYYQYRGNCIIVGLNRGKTRPAYW